VRGEHGKHGAVLAAVVDQGGADQRHHNHHPRPAAEDGEQRRRCPGRGDSNPKRHRCCRTIRRVLVKCPGDLARIRIELQGEDRTRRHESRSSEPGQIERGPAGVLA
jgi:hypothetical protein